MMGAVLDLSRLKAGFADPARESQSIFRRLLDAFAQPGLLQNVADAPEPPTGISQSAAAILLTLADMDTPLWLHAELRGGEAETWLRFHCACPITDIPAEAAFGLIDAGVGMPDLGSFNHGDAKYPDRAATLVVMVDALVGGDTVVLEGPGIETQRLIAPCGLPANFWEQRSDVVSQFQLGIDIVLCAHDAFLALPRSTRIQQEKA